MTSIYRFETVPPRIERAPVAQNPRTVDRHVCLSSFSSMRLPSQQLATQSGSYHRVLATGSNRQSGGIDTARALRSLFGRTHLPLKNTRSEMVSLSGFLDFRPYSHMSQESRRTSLDSGLGTFLTLNIWPDGRFCQEFFH
jgi:hypothetical protein